MAVPTGIKKNADETVVPLGIVGATPAETYIDTAVGSVADAIAFLTILGRVIPIPTRTTGAGREIAMSFVTPIGTRDTEGGRT